MRVDLLAGATYNPAVMPSPVPTILVFDSGLGGLTVFSEVLKIRPDARYVYAADDAGFPYGRLAEAVLAERVVAVMERLIELHDPDIAVVACNTASTLVLPYLQGEVLDSLRRHGPGHQAGGSDHADRLCHGARHPGDGRPRLHPRPHRDLCGRLQGQPRRLAPSGRLRRGGACGQSRLG